MSRAREITLTFFVMYLSPLKPKSCTGHNSHTVSDEFILFDSDIYQVKKECRMEDEQLLLFSFFLVISPERIS